MTGFQSAGAHSDVGTPKSSDTIAAAATAHNRVAGDNRRTAIKSWPAALAATNTAHRIHGATSCMLPPIKCTIGRYHLATFALQLP